MGKRVHIEPRDETLVRFDQRSAFIRNANPSLIFLREEVNSWPRLWLRDPSVGQDYLVLIAEPTGLRVMINDEGQLEATEARPIPGTEEA